jgi:hypothetical protein
MYFPWVGLFEQIKSADVFVHYDNVQLPQGRSFITRVQVKTADGIRWLTAPVRRESGQEIRDVRLDHTTDWRHKHLATLQQAYANSPCRADMLHLVEQVFGRVSDSLSEMNIDLLETISRYLQLDTRFEIASRYDSSSTGTKKLIELCQRFDANLYVTGHGALRYLDHEAFESKGIGVAYMDYRCVEYDQLHGGFTPYVSILDAIANLGQETQTLLQPRTRDWKEFKDE